MPIVCGMLPYLQLLAVLVAERLDVHILRSEVAILKDSLGQATAIYAWLPQGETSEKLINGPSTCRPLQ